MGKINLIIADHDEEYILFFTSFIRNSEFCKNVLVQSFSQLDMLKLHIEKNDDKALLLICSDWVPYVEWSEQRGILVTLYDSQLQINEVDKHAAFKYQPLNKLLTHLVDIYDEKNDVRNNLDEQHSAQVISFYSSVGGCGKTTAAMNLVKQLSALHQKVFYLNLETLSSLEIFMQLSEMDDFARLIYYAKSSSDQLITELNKLVKYDPDIKCDYIHPIKNYKDIEDIEMNDIHLIVQSLVDHYQYDVIIIDLDSSLHPWVRAAMEQSRHIIWMLTDDVHCKLKTRKIWQGLSTLYGMESKALSEKSHFTINKYTGTIVNGFEGDGIHVAQYLPYIPEWKSVHDGKQLFASDMFNRSVMKLFRDVLGIREETMYG